MSTTLLFAELIIIGVQAILWIFLLLLTIFGLDWLNILKNLNLSDWQTTIVIVALSLVYMIGIIVDRIADLLFAGWDKKLRDKICPKPPMAIAVMRFELGKDNEYLNRQFEYTRSRMRISRSSVVNFTLSTLFGLILILTRFGNITPSEKIKYILVIIITGVILFTSALYTWQKLTKTYFGLVKAHWDLYEKKKTALEKVTQKRKGNTLDE